MLTEASPERARSRPWLDPGHHPFGMTRRRLPRWPWDLLHTALRNTTRPDGCSAVPCAREQLDRAVLELSEDVSTDPISAVHAARKAIKKERSLLRLARGAMPREQRRRENAALREAGRYLSGVRDSDVLIVSVDQLSKRFSGQLPAANFRKIRGQFETRRSAKRRNGSVSVVDPQALQELTAIGVRMDDWQLRTQRPRPALRFARRRPRSRPTQAEADPGQHLNRGGHRSGAQPDRPSADGAANRGDPPGSPAVRRDPKGIPAQNAGLVEGGTRANSGAARAGASAACCCDPVTVLFMQG